MFGIGVFIFCGGGGLIRFSSFVFRQCDLVVHFSERSDVLAFFVLVTIYFRALCISYMYTVPFC